jgi:prepilin-type N-terminal cleavage/methylation domain-containing protein
MKPLGNKRAFTLLEVMIAVLLIAMVAVTIQRFVEATLTGIRHSLEREEESEAMSGLFRLIDTQLDDLPLKGQAVIVGNPHHFADQLPSDELEWRCRPGQGTLTGAGEGEWRVTLMLRPQPENARKYDLGLRRRSVEFGTDKDWNWVPLLKDVAGVKFLYFDSRLNASVNRWQDPNARPLLVQMWLWKTRNSLPEMATFTVNSALTQQ